MNETKNINQMFGADELTEYLIDAGQRPRPEIAFHKRCPTTTPAAHFQCI